MIKQYNLLFLYRRFLLTEIKFLFVFVFLFSFSMYVVKGQDPCGANKILNGTFNNNIAGWTVSPYNSWEHGFWDDIWVSDFGKSRAASNSMSLCQNTPKLVKFKFRHSGTRKAFLVVKLGGSQIFKWDSTDGIETPRGVELDKSGSEYTLTVKSYTGTLSGKLEFIAQISSQWGLFTAISIDDVEVYEVKPQRPPNPTATTLPYCEGSTVDLTSLQQADVVGASYEWHTVANNPTTSTKIDAANVATEGIFYLYLHSDCKPSCYSEAANQSVQILLDSDCDGIADVNDLDDDNDGILDTEECGSIDNIEINRKGSFTESFSQRGTFRVEADFYILDNSTRIIINGQDIVGGSGYNGASSTGILTSQTGVGISNGDHLLNFSSDQGLFNSSWDKNTSNLPRLKIVVTESGVELSGTRGPESTSMEDVTIADGSLVIPNFNEGINNVTLVVPDGAGPDGATVSFYMEARGCFRDTDGDGIKNNLDLDSDNDGCPDAIEGGANFDQDDLTSENNLCNSASCIDADGVPTVTNGGQSLGAANKPMSLSFEEQPMNEEVCLGSDASFTAKGKAVVATVYNNGTPDFVNNTTLEPVKYQWQKYNSTSTEWDDIAGEVGTIGSGVEISLNLGAQNDLSNSNSKYRLKLTSEDMSCPIYSGEVTLVVNSLPNNISSPSGFKGGKFCEGEQPTITFNGIEGGNYPYTIIYVDNNNAQYTKTINTSEELTFDAPNLDVNSTSGTYRYKLISITDAKGCSLSESASVPQSNSVFGKKRARIRIRRNPALVLGMAVNDSDVCVGDANPVITFSNSDTKRIEVTYEEGGTTRTIKVDGGSTATVTVPTTSAGIFTYSATSVMYDSEPNCSSSIDKTVCVVVFPKNDSAPTVNSPNNIAIAVTPPPAVTGFNIEYSFDDGATWGANTPPTVDNCEGYKIRTRYKFTGTCASSTTTVDCATSPATTRVLDTTKPTFTKPTDLSVCVNSIIEADYDNTTNGDVNNPPDYYEFEANDTALDLTDLQDNCCTETPEISWGISPVGYGGSISGTGQPSQTIGGKKLWLDIDASNPKSSYVSKTYEIIYNVQDCNGNTAIKKAAIVIKPRPKIDRVDN